MPDPPNSFRDLLDFLDSMKDWRPVCVGLGSAERAELAETVIEEVVGRIRAYVEWRSQMPLPGDAAYQTREQLPVNEWPLNSEAKRWLDRAHLPSSPHLPYLVQRPCRRIMSAPTKSNAAQSRVAIKGKHKFIDKISRPLRREGSKRHVGVFGELRFPARRPSVRNTTGTMSDFWRAAFGPRGGDRPQRTWMPMIMPLCRGSAAAPIQLSRFDFGTYVEARAAFSRDEWMDVVLRSVGLEPSKLTKRLKFHFIARLAPLVEANFNFIELGPRGVPENPTSSASSHRIRP